MAKYEKVNVSSSHKLLKLEVGVQAIQVTSKDDKTLAAWIKKYAKGAKWQKDGRLKLKVHHSLDGIEDKAILEASTEYASKGDWLVEMPGGAYTTRVPNNEFKRDFTEIVIPKAGKGA